MKGLKVETQHKVELNWDADMWELYTVSMDCTEAAEALNKAFVDSVNAGLDRMHVEMAVNKVQQQYRKFGANDSEPEWHLQDLLDATFGKDN